MASSQEDVNIYLLLRCAKKGNLEGVEHLVEEKGVDLNSLDKDGDNALCAATDASEYQVVKYLLSKGANTEIQRKDLLEGHDLTPLYIGAQNGNIDICKLLIENGANLNHKTKTCNILDASIYSDNTECIDLIMKKGNFSVDQYNPDGLTPLMSALSSGRPNSTTFLLQKGADYKKADATGSPILLQASNDGGICCMEILLKFVKSKETRKSFKNYVNQGDPFTKFTALHKAYMFGRQDEVEILLKYGANPSLRDTKGNLPRELQDIGKDQMGQFISDYLSTTGGDVSKLDEDRTVEQLSGSASFGNLDGVKHLVEERGVDINSYAKNCGNALCSATVEGHESIVEYLLTKGARVDDPIKSGDDAEGSTALYFAAMKGNMRLCRLLLQHGANPNHSKPDGTNILDAAINSDKPDCIELILKEGRYDINQYNRMGRTPLINALVFGRRKSTKFLLEKGADYTKSGKSGMTVLEFALRSQPTGENCLETLLEYIKSKKGYNYVSREPKPVDGKIPKHYSNVDPSTTKYREVSRCIYEKSIEKAYQSMAQS